MRLSNALVLAGVTLALAACNRPDANRTTSVPPGVKDAAAVMSPGSTPSAPPAAPERGPVAANANAIAPGTNASVALATPGVTGAPGAGGSDDAAVKAQDAAAGAPDTAGADAAKKAALRNPDTASTARDSEANNPRHGTLTPAEESTAMPKAGQTDNNSSTALEKNSGR